MSAIDDLKKMRKLREEAKDLVQAINNAVNPVDIAMNLRVELIVDGIKFLLPQGFDVFLEADISAKMIASIKDAKDAIIAETNALKPAALAEFNALNT